MFPKVTTTKPTQLHLNVYAEKEDVCLCAAMCELNYIESLNKIKQSKLWISVIVKLRNALTTKQGKLIAKQSLPLEDLWSLK